MAEPYSLAGKHALITGAGSGIGRLMALGAAHSTLRLDRGCLWHQQSHENL